MPSHDEMSFSWPNQTAISTLTSCGSRTALKHDVHLASCALESRRPQVPRKRQLFGLWAPYEGLTHTVYRHGAPYSSYMTIPFVDGISTKVYNPLCNSLNPQPRSTRASPTALQSSPASPRSSPARNVLLHEDRYLRRPRVRHHRLGHSFSRRRNGRSRGP